MSLAMMMAGFSFNAATVEPSEAFVVYPAGWYKGQIDQSEMKATRDGKGRYLELRVSLIDGKYNGKKAFIRLNVENANAETREYAFKDLSAICHAIGVMQFEDTQQLHGRPLLIKVKVRPASGDYEASNDVNGFKPITENIKLCDEAYGAGSAAPAFGAPGAGAPAPFTPPVAPQQQSAPAQPWAAPQQAAPVQQAPVQQQPIQPQQQAPAVQQQAPVQQPWAAPAQQQAPVEQQPVYQQPQQPVAQQQAPQVAQQQAPVQQPQEVQQPVQQPWAQQVIDPSAAVQQAVPQQQAAAPQEPAHPTQAATPPWMQAAAPTAQQ